MKKEYIIYIGIGVVGIAAILYFTNKGKTEKTSGFFNGGRFGGSKPQTYQRCMERRNNHDYCIEKHPEGK